MSLFDVVTSSVGFDVVEWFCFFYSSICVESFSLFTCVLVSMGFAFSDVNHTCHTWNLNSNFKLLFPNLRAKADVCTQ